MEYLGYEHRSGRPNPASSLNQLSSSLGGLVTDVLFISELSARAAEVLPDAMTKAKTGRLWPYDMSLKSAVKLSNV